MQMGVAGNRPDLQKVEKTIKSMIEFIYVCSILLYGFYVPIESMMMEI